MKDARQEAKAKFLLWNQRLDAGCAWLPYLAERNLRVEMRHRIIVRSATPGEVPVEVLPEAMRRLELIEPSHRSFHRRDELAHEPPSPEPQRRNPSIPRILAWTEKSIDVCMSYVVHFLAVPWLRQRKQYSKRGIQGEPAPLWAQNHLLHLPAIGPAPLAPACPLEAHRNQQTPNCAFGIVDDLGSGAFAKQAHRSYGSQGVRMLRRLRPNRHLSIGSAGFCTNRDEGDPCFSQPQNDIEQVVVNTTTVGRRGRASAGFGMLRVNIGQPTLSSLGPVHNCFEPIELDAAATRLAP